MSRNVRLTSRLEIEVRRLMGESFADLCSSAELTSYAADLMAAPAMTPQTVALLSSESLAALADQAGVGGRLAAVRADLSATTPIGLSSDLLFGLADHLGRLERRVVIDLAADTLRVDLGLTVIIEHGEHADALEARVGDEVMLLAVSDGGEIIADQAGTGLCAERMAAFEAGMARRGAAMTRTAIDEHDPEDAPLIAAAAATGEVNLATGIARHVRPPARPVRTPGSRFAASPVVIEGGSVR